MSPQVICLGEGLIDRIFHPSDTPQLNSPCWDDYPGGAPANVATGLAKLGTSAGFVGSVGQDAPGHQFMSTLLLAGVNCSQVYSHPTAQTRVVLVQRNREGERHFIGFSQPKIEGYADTQLQVGQLPVHWFTEASYLVMGTLGLAYPATQCSLEQALKWAQAHQTVVVVDVNWRPVFWPNPKLAPDRIKRFIHQADIVKFSQEEAIWLFQTTSAQAILNQLKRPRLVLITDGAEGCWYATKAMTGKLSAFEVDCEDSTGAGDAFLAGFIHCLNQAGLESLQEASTLQQMIRFASATGALTTLRSGAMTAQPTTGEVDAFLYLQTP
jgi:fructokinase